MRTLMTVQPSVGHLHPLVPIAQALKAAGHDVAVCTSPSFRPEVEAFGLEHVAAGLDWLTSDHSTWTAFPPMPPPGPEFGRFVVTVFADVTARRMAQDVHRIANDWRPDVIVRESMEYGGCLAAERLGIPHASIAGNGYSAVDSPKVNYFPGNRRLVAEPLGRHRAELGMSADPGNEMPFRYLHMCFTPPEWDGGVDVPRPANSVFLRHTNAVKPQTTSLPSLAAGDERPTVLASLGTVFNTTPGVLEAIIGALADERVNLIVAIGPNQDPSQFAPVPPNVRLERYVPQVELLPSCQAFVTHGGFNSVKESLLAGVPMVVIPITADQPYCAQRCSELGVGEVVASDERTPERIRAATLAVLDDPRYREGARSFRNEMFALPEVDHAVTLLENLVTRHPRSAHAYAGSR